MDDIWEVPQDICEKCLGWFAWEARLDAKDTYRLALMRSLMEPELEADFALSFADIQESSEFNSALEETEGDPKARARVRLEAELDAYPYRVNWNAETPEEMQLVFGTTYTL